MTSKIKFIGSTNIKSLGVCNSGGPKKQGLPTNIGMDYHTLNQIVGYRYAAIADGKKYVGCGFNKGCAKALECYTSINPRKFLFYYDPVRDKHIMG